MVSKQIASIDRVKTIIVFDYYLTSFCTYIACLYFVVKGTESPIYLLGVIKQIEEREEERSGCCVQRKVDI